MAFLLLGISGETAALGQPPNFWSQCTSMLLIIVYIASRLAYKFNYDQSSLSLLLCWTWPTHMQLCFCLDDSKDVNCVSWLVRAFKCHSELHYLEIRIRLPAICLCLWTATQLDKIYSNSKYWFTVGAGASGGVQASHLSPSILSCSLVQ